MQQHIAAHISNVFYFEGHCGDSAVKFYQHPVLGNVNCHVGIEIHVHGDIAHVLLTVVLLWYLLQVIFGCFFNS